MILTRIRQLEFAELVPMGFSLTLIATDVWLLVLIGGIGKHKDRVLADACLRTMDACHSSLTSILATVLISVLLDFGDSGASQTQPILMLATTLVFPAALLGFMVIKT